MTDRWVSKLSRRRQTQGEVVGGGYVVFRRGKKWGRIRIKTEAVKSWFFSPFEWPTEDDAIREADRLSKKHPGEKFCVFKQVSMHKEAADG